MARKQSAVTYGNTGQPTKHSQETVNPLPDSCPECTSTNISPDRKRSEVSCDDCGTIVSTYGFAAVAGWKQHRRSVAKNTASVASNTNSGIREAKNGSTIDWVDQDGYDNALSSNRRALIHKLRSYNREATHDTELSQLQTYAASEIRRMSSRLDIPADTQDAARNIMQTILDENLHQGIAIEAIATVALMIACEKENITRSEDEIETVSRASHGEINHTYENLCDSLGITDPATYLDPLEHIADLPFVNSTPEELKEAVHEAVQAVMNDEEVFNAHPTAVHVAAATYAVLLDQHRYLSPADIATQFNVDVEQLSNCYRDHIESQS